MSNSSGFDSIIGQSLAKRILLKAMRDGRIAHAYLFLGLQGTGKLTTALEFGKTLNCESPTDSGSCGKCAVCMSIEHGNFPDMRVWSPKGQDTTIDSMREMRDLASFRPARGKWVVNIIEQGDTLNEDSANCILKLLEEPPEYVVNILLYRNAASVLPTIRSRCQLVRFHQVSAEELAGHLVKDYGASPQEAEVVSVYAQGRPGLAITLLDDKDFAQNRETVSMVAEKAGQGNIWQALGLAEALRKGDSSDMTDDSDEKDTKSASSAKGTRETTNESLEMLLVWYRDLLATKLMGDNAIIVNSDKRHILQDQAARYPHAGPLLLRIGEIQQARQRLRGNANPQMVTELLMMRLAL